MHAAQQYIICYSHMTMAGQQVPPAGPAQRTTIPSWTDTQAGKQVGAQLQQQRDSKRTMQPDAYACKECTHTPVTRTTAWQRPTTQMHARYAERIQ